MTRCAPMAVVATIMPGWSDTTSPMIAAFTPRGCDRIAARTGSACFRGTMARSFPYVGDKHRIEATRSFSGAQSLTIVVSNLRPSHTHDRHAVIADGAAHDYHIACCARCRAMATAAVPDHDRRVVAQRQRTGPRRVNRVRQWWRCERAGTAVTPVFSCSASSYSGRSTVSSASRLRVRPNQRLFAT